jgi:hypothetical protein
VRVSKSENQKKKKKTREQKREEKGVDKWIWAYQFQGLRLVPFSNVDLPAQYVSRYRCMYGMNMSHIHRQNSLTDGQSVEVERRNKMAMADQEGRKRREEGLWSNRQGTRDRRQGGCRRQRRRLDGGRGRGARVRVREKSEKRHKGREKEGCAFPSSRRSVGMIKGPYTLVNGWEG